MATFDDLIAQAVAEEDARIAAEQAALEAQEKARHNEAYEAFLAYVIRVFPSVVKALAAEPDVLSYRVNNSKHYAESRHDLEMVITDSGNEWRIITWEDDIDNISHIAIYPADQSYRIYDHDRIYVTEATAERELLLDIARYRKEHAAPTLTSIAS